MSMDSCFLNSLIFISGLCFGSFLNVLIYRLPNKISPVTPPSCCPSCEKNLKPIDLIPLVSFIFLKGKCRSCGASISWRYPLIELASALLFVLLFRHFGLNLNALFYLSLLYILLAVALIDLEHWVIPNSLIAAGFIAGGLMQLPGLLANWITINPALITDRPLSESILGCLIGGAILLLVFLISKGGMGAGDVKLIAMIGFFVGLRGTAVVLFLAFLIGALVGLTYMLTGKLTRKDALPFGPYLALATLIEVFWGDLIWNWYLNIF